MGKLTTTRPVQRRVAFYSTIRCFPYGAPDELWAHAARRLLRDGHPVFVAISKLVRAHPAVQALAAAGAEVRLLPRLGVGGNYYRLKRHLLNLRDRSHRTLPALAAFRPEIVFISQGGFADFLLEDELRALLATRRIPYVILCHSNREGEVMPDPERTRARDFIAGARRLLANSQHVLELGAQQLVTTFANADVFQNPVSLPAEIPVPWPTVSSPSFAVVARLDAYGKGLDLLIEALARSPGAREDWRLNLYGDGPDHNYLVELAAAHGLAGRVFFHGHVADKAAIWRENHLLLLPSRYEGFGLVMLEALLCGRPVLRTNLGGVAEWMRDGVNGFICPAAEPALLAQTLATAWARRADWPAMGREAHRLALEAYDPNPEIGLLRLAGL